MRFCPNDRRPATNAPQQIKPNEIFAIESKMERSFAYVKSITRGGIEDEIANPFVSLSKVSLKNSKPSSAPSLTVTNVFELESGILLCVLCCLTENLDLGISFGYCRLEDFCESYRLHFETHRSNGSCQWTIHRQLAQRWSHCEKWSLFDGYCLKYRPYREIWLMSRTFGTNSRYNAARSTDSDQILRERIQGRYSIAGTFREDLW
jgi:hypothetical protein